LEKKEKWDAALDRYRQAVELYPKYATAWLEMGRVQIKQGNLLGHGVSGDLHVCRAESFYL